MLLPKKTSLLRNALKSRSHFPLLNKANCGFFDQINHKIEGVNEMTLMS